MTRPEEATAKGGLLEVLTQKGQDFGLTIEEIRGAIADESAAPTSRDVEFVQLLTNGHMKTTGGSGSNEHRRITSYLQDRIAEGEETNVIVPRTVDPSGIDTVAEQIEEQVLLGKVVPESSPVALPTYGTGMTSPVAQERARQRIISMGGQVEPSVVIAEVPEPGNPPVQESEPSTADFVRQAWRVADASADIKWTLGRRGRRS